MKKLYLLILVALNFQLVAQSAFKTLGEIVAGPIIGLHGKSKKKHHSHKHSHKKNKSSSAPTVMPAANPQLTDVANIDDAPYQRGDKVINNVVAEKQPIEVVAAPVSPETVIPALPSAAIPTELVDSFEIYADDAFEAHGHLYANPTTGSDDISTTLACQAYQAPQELGYKARAAQWLKNSWTQVPSLQQMNVSCSNALDELQFHAYKHRVAIAATVTVALVAGGGYYWYKNYKAKEADKN